MHTDRPSKQVIREDIPTSGSSHQHDWQVIKEDATSLTMVCRRGDCSATKTVGKPGKPHVESTDTRPVLLG